MLRFTAFLIERAATDAIVNFVSTGHVKDIGAPRFGIQFILPDGKPVELNNELVHARAVREGGLKHSLNIQLIDVLEAGIVRAASTDMYQVGSRITSAQAQFMVDRAQTHGDGSIYVSIADPTDPSDFRKLRPEGDDKEALGPIEINDKDNKSFDLDRAKAITIRNWVNSHY